jgi:hypothetical protein
LERVLWSRTPAGIARKQSMAPKPTRSLIKVRTKGSSIRARRALSLEERDLQSFARAVNGRGSSEDSVGPVQSFNEIGTREARLVQLRDVIDQKLRWQKPTQAESKGSKYRASIGWRGRDWAGELPVPNERTLAWMHASTAPCLMLRCVTGGCK